MRAELRVAVAEALGRPIVTVRRASGGDINDAYIVETRAAPVFVKARADAPPQTFEVEARGLRWLAEPGVIAVPDVLAVGRSPAFLALSVVPTGPTPAGVDERIGRQLAALHQSGAPHFGLDHDNFIGALVQDNTPRERWSDFYWDRRLAPMLDRARGYIDRGLRAEFEQLRARLPERVGPTEPPARLHGDLWSGNHLVDAQGNPVLIDPACYGGHREVDLAMMKLFGGFSSRVFEAYDEVYPLAAGWRQRIPLYQLYPLLVHVNLFGGGYVGQLRAALQAVV